MFPRLYDNFVCPIEGYEAYTVRLLLNPTGQERTAWFSGLSNPDTASGALSQGCVAIYGETKTSGLDFSTVEAAQATLDSPDLPDELLSWLFLLPNTVWSARQDDLKKKLLTTSTRPT